MRHRPESHPNNSMAEIQVYHSIHPDMDGVIDWQWQ